MRSDALKGSDKWHLCWTLCPHGEGVRLHLLGQRAGVTPSAFGGVLGAGLSRVPAPMAAQVGVAAGGGDACAPPVRPTGPPVMALRISRAASSRISMDACSLYQAACGVHIRLGASFRGPWLKLGRHSRSECEARGRVEGALPGRRAPKGSDLPQGC